MEAGDLDTVAHEWRSRRPPRLQRRRPIIRLVNSSSSAHAKERASDIHIEPPERDICVPSGGRLVQEVILPAQALPNSIISRVKSWGRAEHRREAAAAGRRIR